MNEPVRQAWTRAMERATAERIVVFKVGDHLGVGSVIDGALVTKPYVLTIHGDRPLDVTCTCKAGEAGRICKHRAAAVYARKYGVYAVAPVTTSAAVA